MTIRTHMTFLYHGAGIGDIIQRRATASSANQQPSCLLKPQLSRLEKRPRWQDVRRSCRNDRSPCVRTAQRKWHTRTCSPACHVGVGRCGQSFVRNIRTIRMLANEQTDAVAELGLSHRLKSSCSARRSTNALMHCLSPLSRHLAMPVH